MTDYLSLNIEEINELLKQKKIKPLDLVNEAFAKIEKSNTCAFITLNKEEAIRKAKELENKEVDNLLFGIPIAIKDNISTKNLRTTCASLMLDNYIPLYDATVIEKINEKNMIIIGKTNMDEFAMGSTGETSYYGSPKNPFDNEMVSGGSSSGSAISVAERIVPFALGTDTGGSIRQPSSFCGIVGLKPTYGRVSRYGLVAFASSLDQIGPMTKNVKENALLLNVISGYDKNDQTSSKEIVKDYTKYLNTDISNLKVAIPTYYLNEKIDKTVKNKVLEIADLLKKNGVTVDIIDIPYLEYAIPLYQVIALGEASSNLARFDGIKYGYKAKDYTSTEDFIRKTRSEGFGREVKRRIMIGSFVLSGENAKIYYNKALTLRKEMTNSFKKVFEKYDLIIGPTNTDVAYKLGTKQDDALKSFYDDLLTIPVNMAGLPAMSLPVGLKNNLPIGLQIIGNYFKEETIYQLASFIEKELNLKFPENYVENLKGKDVLFKVKLNLIKKIVLPEVNEEFFKDLGYEIVKDEAGLKEKVKADLLAHKEEDADNKYLDELIGKAVETLEVEINPEIIEDEKERMIDDYRRELSMQGISLEQYLEFTKGNLDTLKKNIEPQAVARIKTRYLLEGVVEKENLTVTDDEVKAEVKRLAEMYGTTEEEITTHIGDSEVIGYDLKMRKALDFLKEN